MWTLDVSIRFLSDDPLLPTEWKTTRISSEALQFVWQTTKRKEANVEWDGCPDGFQLLCEVVSLITGGDAERMIIVNLDEMNRLAGEIGRAYLQGVLGATKKVNALKNKVGFLYVILSGTNPWDLHTAVARSPLGQPLKRLPCPC